MKEVLKFEHGIRADRVFGSLWRRFHIYYSLEGLEERKKKKTSLRVRDRVGSPTSTGHGPIEVNIYGRTLLPL